MNKKYFAYLAQSDQEGTGTLLHWGAANARTFTCARVLLNAADI